MAKVPVRLVPRRTSRGSSAEDGRTGGLVTKDEHTRFESILTRSLTGEKVDFRALTLRPTAKGKVDHAWMEGHTLPIVIRFDNANAEDSTVIDLETEDRLGLLYEIAEVFASLQLDIQLAKIITEHGAALDSFYVVDSDGSKIESIHRQQFIETRVRTALVGLLTAT